LIGETIEDDVGDAFCNRIDEFLRDRHLELRGEAVHDSMMPLGKLPATVASWPESTTSLWPERLDRPGSTRSLHRR
jgi:hypothetical protein